MVADLGEVYMLAGLLQDIKGTAYFRKIDTYLQ